MASAGVLTGRSHRRRGRGPADIAVPRKPRQRPPPHDAKPTPSAGPTGCHHAGWRDRHALVSLRANDYRGTHESLHGSPRPTMLQHPMAIFASDPRSAGFRVSCLISDRARGFEPRAQQSRRSMSMQFGASRRFSVWRACRRPRTPSPGFSEFGPRPHADPVRSTFSSVRKPRSRSPPLARTDSGRTCTRGRSRARHAIGSCTTVSPATFAIRLKRMCDTPARDRHDRPASTCTASSCNLQVVIVRGKRSLSTSGRPARARRTQLGDPVRRIDARRVLSANVHLQTPIGRTGNDLHESAASHISVPA